MRAHTSELTISSLLRPFCRPHGAVALYRTAISSSSRRTTSSSLRLTRRSRSRSVSLLSVLLRQMLSSVPPFSRGLADLRLNPSSHPLRLVSSSLPWTSSALPFALTSPRTTLTRPWWSRSRLARLLSCTSSPPSERAQTSTTSVSTRLLATRLSQLVPRADQFELDVRRGRGSSASGRRSSDGSGRRRG